MNQIHIKENWLLWLEELSQNDFVIIDNFISPILLKQIQTLYEEKLPLFKEAGIGSSSNKMINTKIRGDSIYWLEPAVEHSIQPFWTLIDETIAAFKQHIFLSLNGFEFHFSKYPPGTHYHKHLDQFGDDKSRVISMVFYLNEDWKPGEGGELELYTQEGIILVQPLAMRCVMFKSGVLYHAVKPTDQARKSLTGWLLYKTGFIL